MRSASALRVGHEPDTGVDLAAAEQAAAQFLQALGVELSSESLRGTPGRMARAHAELFTPRPFDLTTLGSLREDARSRQEFFALSGVNAQESR